MKILLVGLILLVFVIGGETFGRVMHHKELTKSSAKKGINTKKVTKKVKCPVTGTEIDPATAKLKTIYKGKTYYFCCPGCPEEFKKNPEKYKIY